MNNSLFIQPYTRPYSAYFGIVSGMIYRNNWTVEQDPWVLQAMLYAHNPLNMKKIVGIWFMPHNSMLNDMYSRESSLHFVQSNKNISRVAYDLLSR